MSASVVVCYCVARHSASYARRITDPVGTCAFLLAFGWFFVSAFVKSAFQEAGGGQLSDEAGSQVSMAVLLLLGGAIGAGCWHGWKSPLSLDEAWETVQKFAAAVENGSDWNDGPRLRAAATRLEELPLSPEYRKLLAGAAANAEAFVRRG